MNSADERSRHRLAVLATHPVQYQCPLWRKLAEANGFIVKVFFGSDFSIRGYQDREFATKVAWSGGLLHGVDHEFLGHSEWHPVMFRAANGLNAALSAFNATDVLLNAYLPIFYWQGLAWARRNKARVHFRGDTTDVDRARGPLTRSCRNWLLSLFYSRVDSFCAVGNHSRSHYLARGVSHRKIWESPFCVDTDAFEKLYFSHQAHRSEIRSSWRLGDRDLVLVFSGKLIPKKDPLAAIHAIATLPSVRGRALKLVVAGDGPLRTICEQKASELAPGRVIFLGFTSQENLAKVYTAGDALVLPSIRSETWGLVVNEALQFGLPCVVSDRVGSKDDLIINGMTGEVFRAGDIASLRFAIANLAVWLEAECGNVADQCRRMVSRYSLDAAAAGIVAAVRSERDNEYS